ncbi:glycosyltransferase [Pseudonocardia humida]|uniref:Glycosyltransferase n=1 Tax=Pseudonocardia humida TaxID=2800819 RepID=A0ABT1A5H4_9PSEU|nr:glycosyltransferase [Pseudonocardia humida]MCO1658245.1 glycosyltransferase [Pseudonocardia humida]
MSPTVLHVSQPTTEGVAAVVAQLVADQVGRGWDVRVACPPGPLAERVAAGARVHAWPAVRSPGPSTPSEALRLRRVLREVRPDVVHLHSSKAGLAGRLAVRGRVPTIFQPHMWSFQVAGGALGRASLAWERWAAARWTTRLLCVGDDELAVARANGIGQAAVVVPNGVDTDALVPADRTDTRRELGLADAPTVVCVGRLAEQKGQDLLLRAWPTVLAQVPDARLELVGSGPAEHGWRAGEAMAAHPSVHWAGGTDRPGRWYAAADVVALPSRAEGLALVPLEAMASARPVVAFDVGGVRQSLGEGADAAGAVVTPGDVESLAKELAARLIDPATAQAEGRRGRARAVERFDRRATTGRVADLVTELAAGPTGVTR